MSGLGKPLNLTLPDHWTPEQALAVFELLNELADAVWQRYELPLREQLMEELQPVDTGQRDLFDFDDPLPF